MLILDVVTADNNNNDILNSEKNIVILSKSISELTLLKEMEEQLIIFNFPMGTDNINQLSIQNLSTLLNCGVSSYFDLLQKRGVFDMFSTQLLDNIKSKIYKLRYEIQNLQSNVQIPEIMSIIPSNVRSMITTNSVPQSIMDMNIINELQSQMNEWIRQIQFVISQENDYLNNSISEEISFWSSKEKALLAIKKQMESPEALIIAEILQNHKRTHASIALLSATSLKEALKVASTNNNFLKNLYPEAINTSESINQIQYASENWFESFKKLKAIKYPPEKAIHILELLMTDFETHAIEILAKENLLCLDNEVFESIFNKFETLLIMLDSDLRTSINLIREELRKQNNMFVPINIGVPTHIKETLIQIREMRNMRSELDFTLYSLRGTDTTLAKHEILKELKLEAEKAFDDIKDTDIVTLFHNHKQMSSIKVDYSKRVLFIEEKLSEVLRLLLLSASDEPDTLLSIFKKFSTIMNKPHIRLMLNDFFSIILSTAEKELENIELQCQLSSKIENVFTQKGLPKFSSKLYWIQQIILSIQNLVEHLETVLSKEWASYPEGKLFSVKLDNLLRELNIEKLVKGWIQDTTQKISTSPFNTPILRKLTFDEGSQTFCVNKTNDDMQLMTEIMCLEQLNLNVPGNIKTYAKKLDSLYLQSLSLEESLNHFLSMLNLSGNMEMFQILIKERRAYIFDIINRIYRHTWLDILRAEEIQQVGVHYDAASIMGFIKTFHEKVFEFSNDIHFLRSVCDQFHLLLQKLSDCVYDSDDIATIINEIQCCINTVADRRFTNADQFLDSINKKVFHELFKKCQLELNNFPVSGSQLNSSCKKKHQLYLENLSINLKPNLFETKETFIAVLNEIVSVVKSQFQITLVGFGQREKLLFDFYNEQLQLAYGKSVCSVIESFTSAKTFAEKWGQLQFLWNTNIKMLKPSDEHNLLEWLKLFDKISLLQLSLDLSETHKIFGLFEIEYDQIQNLIFSQFKTFQTQILAHFFPIFKYEFNNFLKIVEDLRISCQSVMFDVTNSNAVLLSLSKLQECKVMLNKNDPYISQISKAYQIISENEYILDKETIQYAALSRELDLIATYISTQTKHLDQNKNIARNLIGQKIEQFENQYTATKNVWMNEKPKSDTSVNLAILTLNKYEEIYGQMDMLFKNITNACALTEQSFNVDISSDVEEISNLKKIWRLIQKRYLTIDDVRSQLWKTCSLDNIRKCLENEIIEFSTLPMDVKTYGALQNVQFQLKQILKEIPFWTSIETSKLDDSHWDEIFKTIHQTDAPPVLTLGNICDLRLLEHEKIVKTVISKAESEWLIKQSILQIEDYWKAKKPQVYKLNDEIDLLTGWEAVLNKIDDDIGVLESISASPYFYKFQNNVKLLESKLQQFSTSLATLYEVQKQWVYLLGVFDNKMELGRLLPLELSRFETISLEIELLISSVIQGGFLFSITDIPDITITTQRIYDFLHKIKSSLIGYLEKQRRLFPRFYFMGNDDLLELMGNSSNYLIINKHIKKLFPGITLVSYNENTMLITSVTSSEGETIELEAAVSLAQHSGLINSLTALDNSLKATLVNQIRKLGANFNNKTFHDTSQMLQIMELYSHQAVLVVLHIHWTAEIEHSIEQENYEDVIQQASALLKTLTKLTKLDLTNLERTKVENMIIETIHKCEVLYNLKLNNFKTLDNPIWFLEQKFYLDHNYNEPNSTLLKVTHGTYTTHYGFEYTGVLKKLAYTPLMTSTYALLAEAMEQNLGGLLLGPAGTGKTESIKSLGHNLGRLVFVFCCDESFDYESVSRIMLGIAHVGGWGCFDEFNRLETQILSGITTQIERIQTSLMQVKDAFYISEEKHKVHENTGIFLTSNPSYDSRSTLPDNLKSRFLTYSMIKPDLAIISKVLFASQGFFEPEQIAELLVIFFNNMKQRCTKQKHYDFGLRTLKSVILHCGKLNRQYNRTSSLTEIRIICQGLIDVILPRLTSKDEITFQSEISKVHEQLYSLHDTGTFTAALLRVAKTKNVSSNKEWLKKSEQIYEISKLHHGFMLVGSASVGKSTMFDCVLQSISNIHHKENEVHRIDAKSLTKESIFGELDYATREWKDGILSSILRKANDTILEKNIWVVFDGDIDPNWVENLNSVLDDNKMLTLPTGERIPLLKNVHVVFEIDSLDHATPATISRCGIVLFNEPYFTVPNVLNKLLFDVKKSRLNDEELFNRQMLLTGYSVDDLKDVMINSVSNSLDQSTLEEIWRLSLKYNYVIGFHIIKSIRSLKNLICSNLLALLKYIKKSVNTEIDDFYLYFQRNLIMNIIWSFAGELDYSEKVQFTTKLIGIPKLKSICGDVFPADLIYSQVNLPKLCYHKLSLDVAPLQPQPHMILETNIVIPTVDTMAYECLIMSILNQNESLILCGPPGSGKTMLLLKCIRESAHFELLSLNFSKETTIFSIIKALEQSCQYRKNVNGVILGPKTFGKSLILFCDEVNLPKSDKYGTQKVIQFLRQIVGHKGFWHPKDCVWVSLQNVQFVGACNPVSTFGRLDMSQRFTNLCSIIMVDYPSPSSLKTIYQTYCKALLKLIPDLVEYDESLCDSMLYVYSHFTENYKLSDKSHYICSPRELTRWIRGIYVVLKSKITLDIPGLLRIWAHEGLRILSDRLVTKEERDWVYDLLKQSAGLYFPHTNIALALKAPILFSDWLSLEYESTDEGTLKEFVKERFNVFSQEETNVDIVLYDDLLDHVLRIDRVFKNIQGHMILVGPNGSGKTTLAKFVAWMNGVQVSQLNVKRDFALVDFENCLKDLLIQAAVKGNETCFIIDESTILEDSFLEKMNTLLANAEAPGLFNSDEYEALMNMCSNAAQSQGLLLNSNDEIYQWFVERTAKNFHVIFTMSDPYSSNLKPFISSSALFNRCVINWMGPWSTTSISTVTMELTKKLPLDNSEYKVLSVNGLNVGLREAVVEVLIQIHQRVEAIIEMQLAPTQILLLIKTFESLFVKRETDLQTTNSHVHKGLDHLKETFLKVKRLEKLMTEKETELKLEDDKARKLLDKMITDQNESERKQDMSIKMQELFADQESLIIKRRKQVVIELKEVEELINEAQRGVLNIKKQHLTELRSMHNPPDTIKLILESICIMLGYKVSSWRDVQHVIRQDEFIANIINFDSEEQVSHDLIEYMTKTYISKENFNFESANRASKACGPLLMWVKAQLKFSSIVVKVKPLKNELKKLEANLVDTKAKLIAINSMIDDLKEEVEDYKMQYSETIRIKENIKTEMNSVKIKLHRSVKLMKSLSAERQRWETNIKEYDEHKQCLVGDSLLIAAFAAYCGFLLPGPRIEAINIWKDILDKKNVKYDSSISPAHIPGLVSAESTLKWQSMGLPQDDQFIGNTAILTSPFKARFSFIIDPSNMFFKLLSELLAPNQLVISSFLDPEFYKKLENCLKFGGTIVIEDGEHYDPIINRLIAREFYTLGVGRMMVRLCDKEIDMSPAFQLYISTKDPNVNIPPFVFSRMDVLNYSFTTESMVNESLNIALKMRKPEIEAKRLELITTNNECKYQLRNFETELLKLLNTGDDNILDNDHLLTQLELIKEKTLALELQMKEADDMMKIYSDIRNEFTSLGELYAKITKLIKSLANIRKFYLFPNNYIKDIYSSCLESNPTLTVEELEKELSTLVLRITSVSLLSRDKTIISNAINKIAKTHDFSEMGIDATIMENTYIIIRSSAGKDMTLKVKELAQSVDVPAINFALGARNGHSIASKMIKDSKSRGSWIIIENIETSSDFLKLIPDLLEFLETEHEQNTFKLIMTCGIESHIPPLIIKSCKQILIENEFSLKKCISEQMLLESSSLSIYKFANVQPREMVKVIFMVVWLYSLIVLRLKYFGYGFTKNYEVNEHDLRSAGKFVAKCFEKQIASKRKMGSEALATVGLVVAKLILGGKIEEKADIEIILNCAKLLFSENMFSNDFNILRLDDSCKLIAPTGFNTLDYVNWIEELPDPEPIEWLGLTKEAEDAVKINEDEIEKDVKRLLEETL